MGVKVPCALPARAWLEEAGDGYKSKSKMAGGDANRGRCMDISLMSPETHDSPAASREVGM